MRAPSLLAIMLAAVPAAAHSGLTDHAHPQVDGFAAGFAAAALFLLAAFRAFGRSRSPAGRPARARARS